ncbi:hypothetical protein L210DRAFT_947813, partial [Boletus edulis BED1]
QLCTHAQPSAIPLSSLTLSQVEADAHLTSSPCAVSLTGLPLKLEANVYLTPSHACHRSRKGCRASDAQPSAHHPPQHRLR